MRLFVISLLFVVGIVNNGWCDHDDPTGNMTNDKILVEFLNLNRDSASASYLELDVPHVYEFQKKKGEVRTKAIRFEIFSSNAIFFNYREVINGKADWNWLLESGDSVVVRLDESLGMHFSGRGYEKLNLQRDLLHVKMNVKNPVGKFTHVRTVNDYLQFNDYLKALLKAYLPVFEKYKPLISEYAYQYLRTAYIGELKYFRGYAFQNIINPGEISAGDLCELYDSTYLTAVERSVLSSPVGPQGDYTFIQNQVYRRFKFNSDSLNDKASRKSLYYNEAKKTYKGLVLEQYLLDLLTYFVIKKVGFTAETEQLLSKYYAESEYPEYKKFLRAFEAAARNLKEGNLAPEFSLTDAFGQRITTRELRGKVVLIDFWFTGCPGCVEMASALKHVKESFQNDSNLVLLSVSVDKDKNTWLRSISGNKYTSAGAFNAYTNGLGRDDSIVHKYNVMAYPSLFLLDGEGRIARNPVPDPRSDKGETLITLIKSKLALVQDGPYILRETNSNAGVITTVSGNYVISNALDPSREFLVATDLYDKYFNVLLKKNFTKESAVYHQPEKLLVLSDIEGNFYALRKLLQSNKVIDDEFNWIFGSGHLVFVGDMFDRGSQVTECLWLMYSLEEEALKSGGHVHFILGNHEIMNLNGNHRYTREKYHFNSELLKTNYSSLYSENTELGKWLRTKNIMERIGNLLVVHGGISPEVNDLPMSLDELNKLARIYYDKDSIAKKSSNKSLAILFNTEDELSPLWYRKYYLDEEMKVYLGGSKGIDTVYRTSMNTVDATLKKFAVSYIVTGHTIPKNQQGTTRITTHFNGKVINTDTWHFGGQSEALLIEGKKFYRVNSDGERWPLFVRDVTNIKKN